MRSAKHIYAGYSVVFFLNSLNKTLRDYCFEELILTGELLFDREPCLPKYLYFLLSIYLSAVFFCLLSSRLLFTKLTQSVFICINFKSAVQTSHMLSGMYWYEEG